MKGNDSYCILLTFCFFLELNRYYNSDLDYELDLTMMTHSICGLVNSTANAIYKEASNTTSSSSISADCTLISNLLECLTSNFSCPFMQNYFNGIRNPHSL